MKCIKKAKIYEETNNYKKIFPLYEHAIRGFMIVIEKCSDELKKNKFKIRVKIALDDIEHIKDNMKYNRNMNFENPTYDDININELYDTLTPHINPYYTEIYTEIYDELTS